jgi:hypothetical protein
VLFLNEEVVFFGATYKLILEQLQLNKIDLVGIN